MHLTCSTLRPMSLRLAVHQSLARPAREQYTTVSLDGCRDSFVVVSQRALQMKNTIDSRFATPDWVSPSEHGGRWLSAQRARFESRSAPSRMDRCAVYAPWSERQNSKAAATAMQTRPNWKLRKLDSVPLILRAQVRSSLAELAKEGRSGVWGSKRPGRPSNGIHKC